MSRWLEAAGAAAVLAIAVGSGMAFSALYRPDVPKPDQRDVALAESLAPILYSHSNTMIGGCSMCGV